jgi:hypothetical protein
VNRRSAENHSEWQLTDPVNSHFVPLCKALHKGTKCEFDSGKAAIQTQWLSAARVMTERQET